MNEWIPKPGSITTYDNAVAEWFVVRYKNRNNSLLVRNDAYSVVFCVN